MPWKKNLTLVLCASACLYSSSFFAQQTLFGEIFEAGTNEALIGASIVVQGTTIGTTTEWDGSFLLKVDQVPTTLVVSYTGYNATTIRVTDSKTKIKILLEPSAVLIETIEVVGSRVSDKRKESPLTVESLDLVAIKETASNDFYEGLGSLKGVDLTTASLGFTVINTRGFNSTSPVRSLQIIDGVDNQSPGLNFSLGNFLGAPELDVLKVELIQGASSAFFGPNAFNGVIDIRTKDPFIHQGLSVSFKYGERNLLKTELRYAKAFKNNAGEDKFAFKINGAYLSAHDWEATNTNPTEAQLTRPYCDDEVDHGQTLVVQNDISNPGGYDAVNIYGDEGYDLRAWLGPFERIEYPGLKIYHRQGYAETDLVDYDTKNIKGNLGVFYYINSKIQVNGVFNFGSGTTVYQGENRFRLKDILFWQTKLELKQEGKFFLRAYMTEEDAGKTYDAYTTALRLQNAAKANSLWDSEYTQHWISFIRPKVRALPEYPTGFPFNFDQQEVVFSANADLLRQWHAEAQAKANAQSLFGTSAFFEPGTPAFDSMFNIITSNLATDSENPGTRFYDKSGLVHVHGEYIIESRFANFTAGANYRQYRPDSKGTIFSDTMGVKITNSEFGVYAGIDKKLIPTRLKLNITGRLDKNENFDMVFSPAASIVFTPDINHVLRLSFSSALRNPTLSDQYLFLDVGRAQLLGNITGYDSLITVGSFVDYLCAQDQGKLVYFNEPSIQPEKVKSIEIGYRGTLFDRLWLDAGYYYSWYQDFIGYKIGIKSDFVSNFPLNPRVYRIASNAESEVTTQGFCIGASYYLTTFYTISGNYCWNVLNKKGADDPIIPAFNTPENKFNFGLSGRGMPLDLGLFRLDNTGFNITYKWIEGFLFEGSPQFTGSIPTYDLVDAQFNWKVEKLDVTFKIGASNVLNKKQFQTYGGPRIGRLAYFSLLYEKSN